MVHQIFSFKVIEEQKMSESMDLKIRTLLCKCFPEDVNVYSHTRYWHNSAPAYSLLCQKKDFLLGQVGVVEREIVCKRKKLLVAGIENLAVHPRFRSRGVGKELMIKAQNEAIKRYISYGMLFCTVEMKKFYLSLGWHEHNNPVTMDDLSGNSAMIPVKDIPMVKAFSGGKFPVGEIYLQGHDW